MKVLIDPAPRRKRGAGLKNQNAAKDPAKHKRPGAIHIRATDDFKERLRVYAESVEMSVTDLVTIACEAFMERGEG